MGNPNFCRYLILRFYASCENSLKLNAHEKLVFYSSNSDIDKTKKLEISQHNKVTASVA